MLSPRVFLTESHMLADLLKHPKEKVEEHAAALEAKFGYDATVRSEWKYQVRWARVISSL